jgi:hypothetical protein
MIGIHPTTIAQSFQNAATKAVEFLEGMSTPVDLNDREALLRAAGTSLNSKVGSPCTERERKLMTDRLPILLHPRPHRSICGHSTRHPNLFECRFERYPISQEGRRYY